MAQIPELILYTALFLVLYFQVFLLLTFFEDKKRKNWFKTPENNDFFPSVTIIVPCYNEEKTVALTLDSLLQLHYPKDKLHLIAVNDGSKDGTLSILKKYEREHGIMVLDKENGGKHTALNFAIEHVSTELVGCLDADSFVNPNALVKMTPYLKDPSVMAVTPAIVVHSPKNILQMIQRAEYNTGLFIRRMLCNLNSLHVTPGPFSIFRKTVFDTIGGYKHGHNTEDMELAMRMQKHHMKIENSPESYVYTVTPETVGALHKQRVRWIYGFLKNAADYKDLFFNFKYGNFGIYLPFAYFTVFASIYFFFFMLYNLITQTYKKIMDIVVFGVDWNWKFEWFFINTEMMLFLGAVLISITLFVLITSRRMSEEKGFISKDIFLFMLTYSFLSPFWFMKAIYNAVTSREANWR
jgi:cellulose synthase/poly-beta-1,6-N-acetylglucosamine synthase-like glycosyltransferase